MMRSHTKQVLALAMVAMMLLSGCAGWGQDGPADSDDESENDTTDDLENAQNDTQNDTNTSEDGDDSDSSADSDSSSDSSTDSDSSDGDSSSDSSTDSDADSDSSSTSSDKSDSSDSSSDSTDSSGDSDAEPQGSDPGDDGSTDGDSDSDTDSSDTDSDKQDSKDSDTDDKKSGDGSDGTDGDDGADGDDGTDGDDGDDGDDTNGDDPADPDTHELKVTVINHNDEPIEGASVSVFIADGGNEVASGETDSDGIATFDLESGEYDIVADHEDAIGDGANRVTVEGDTEASVKLDTSDGLATGKVIVVDQNGDPIEGEPVILSPPGTVDDEGKITEHTNEDGEVVIELAAGAPEDVVMYGVEVRDQEQTLAIMADAYTEVQEVTFEVDTSENGEPETHSLDVSVTDPNEDPVEGASVSIVTYDGGADVASGNTNSDGVATFDVPNGDYEAVVTTEDDDLLQPSDQRLVTVDGGDATLDVQMQASGDNGNGNGEETYTLTVYADSAVTLESAGEDGMSETKEPEDGVVTFEVPAGGYTLAAEGYHWADVPLVEEDTEIELQSTDGATMDITVVDSETGNGVGGAEISGECDLWYTGGDSYVETTSASEGDGVVTVQTGVTPTSCDANVSAPGYEGTQISLDAPGDDGRTIELEATNPAVPEPNESGNETPALV